MSEQARLNATAITDNLGVDYLMFAPAWSFLARMYRESAISPESTLESSDQASQRNMQLLHRLDQRLHDQARSPAWVELVAGGYIGGQVRKTQPVWS